MRNSSARRVAVTGLGVVAPFDDSAAGFFANLCAGVSQVRLYRHPLAQTPLELPAVFCDGFDAGATIGRKLANTMDRFSQLGMAAALAAWRDAGLSEEAGRSEARWGVSWGTGVGGTLTFEQGYRDIMRNGRERVSPLSVVLAMNNACASQISIHLGLGSASPTFSVACSSSAVAIGEAFLRIRRGEDDLVLAGGSEAPLSEGVMRAWEAMRVLAPGDERTAPEACRPFARGRQGLVLGEGAGVLILEEWEHARARGARIYAELAGYGGSSDHKHLVRPEAEGQARAMRVALDRAGLKPAEVGYVNAHGTATPEGDPIEIAALCEVFGAHAAALPVSATKSMHGHLLGATGAVEALATVLAVHEGRIPPTAHLDEVSADCAGVRHVREVLEAPLDAALCNSFAFGGSNAVLAFRRAGE